KYKSEFLANMSHELRTPLNSMLILSQLLQDNTEGNLTDKQVEYASTIHGAGSDLLSLINEILDLSKIESGAMELEVIEIPFNDIKDHVERTFRPVASGQGREFGIELARNLPKGIIMDEKRLQQVLKNLLSNAFKFTEKGKVGLKIDVATSGWSFDNESLNHATRVIAFEVSDTGIGIPEDKQKVIFEAFQQVDGTTSRKYGGTGLGLSISREIANLFGGEIKLTSKAGEGSTFILYLPQIYTPIISKVFGGTLDAENQEVSIGNPKSEIRNLKSKLAPLETELEVAISDDRADIQSGDKFLLIVEDDTNFARILLDLARERGFRGIVAVNGEAGLALARKYKPDAITLDLHLPEMDGWTLLDILKHDSATKHIPVHIISVEEDKKRGLKMGAVTHLTKPVTKEMLEQVFVKIKGFVERKAKKLLIVEDDKRQRKNIVELVGNGDIETTAVGSGKEALDALKKEQFDCMVLDLGLPDMTGFDLIEKIRKEPALGELPIIIYTGKELTPKDETKLRKLSDSIIIKDVKSPERLLAETTLFLHRVEANLPETKRKMLRQIHLADPQLSGKKVLIVDDDVRNIFTLTSVLERSGIEVVYAENGKDGIKLLEETPNIDIVLMDIMMPEMDGYETIGAIKKNKKFKSLPIIALTAKAMKGDKEKCIDAGASDYISKPVDNERLLSLLRVWMYK
ncbi:MAG: response regulator, partial [Nitrospirota bacterium]